MEPTFFANPDDFRAWLERHHASESELRVGFYKRGSGRAGITQKQAVDQALCFGWIDGRTNRIDDSAYMVRFTPRKPASIWSNVNVARVEELTRLGLMRPAGVAAFERRTAERSGVYSFERSEAAALEPEQEARFRANASAWEWFESQAPWYRRAALHWVVSAKRPETRERRLATLIEDSAGGRRIKTLTQP
jgi:uncharacterized protein YdeI (YjbR/CyaY-like superfamily)